MSINRPSLTFLPIHAHVRGLEPSPTVAINELCDDLRRQGRSISKLGLGQSPFPVPSPVVEALKANAARKEYLPVRGLPELRSAVAEYHRRRCGVPWSHDDVLIGPGSKELMFLLQVVYDGEILIPTPAWVSYAPQAQVVGRRVSFLHTKKEDGWKFVPEQLAAHCEKNPGCPRVLILNYPSNPTGGTFTGPELEAIAEVARHHRVVVLSDEIYGELDHQGAHVSVAQFYPEGTIISSGLSKWCGAGGWRLGTFTFPRDLRWLLDAMAAVASETFTATSAPIQCAAVTAFRGGMEIERYLWNARLILHALGGWTASTLTRAGVDVLTPSGGFYVFPDFGKKEQALRIRGISSSTELCRRLLEDTGVAILPGEVFGRPAGELTARIAYVDFDGARALAALEHSSGEQAAPIDTAFLRAQCGRVLEAIEHMVVWLGTSIE